MTIRQDALNSVLFAFNFNFYFFLSWFKEQFVSGVAKEGKSVYHLYIGGGPSCEFE